MNGICRNCDELVMYDGKPSVVASRPAPGASCTSFIRVKLKRTSRTVFVPNEYTLSTVAPQFSRVRLEPVAALPKKLFFVWNCRLRRTFTDRRLRAVAL